MDAREFGAQVEDLEKKVERLRALYEQYFMGIERTEPGVLRHDVERQFRALRRERCPNTAQRFRFQTLIQRYTTLSAYWQRTCRAIEEGTYQPHILRAQRRIAREAAEAAAAGGRPPAGIHDLTDAVELDLEPDAATPAPPPAAASIPPPLPGAKRARSLEELKRLLEVVGSEPPPPEPPSGATDGPPAAPPAEPPPTPPPGRATTGPADPSKVPSASRSPRPVRSMLLSEGRPMASPLVGPAVSPEARPAIPLPQRPILPAGGGTAAASGPSRAAGSPSSKPAVSAGRPAEAGAPSSAAASSPATPAAPRPGGGVVSEEKVRAIHAAFAAAAKGAPAPSPAAIRKSLEREFERLSQKHPGRRVDFRVDLKDGKPVIKSFVT